MQGSVPGATAPSSPVGCTITPLPLGLFTVPGREVAKYPGVTIRAPFVVCAYLVRTPAMTLLFDTGIVGDEEAVSRYRPRYFPLAEQLAVHDIELDDVDVVVNCHLHADHAGGNHLFPRTPIFAQVDELAVADDNDYTVREACVAFPGAEFVPVKGPHAITEEVSILPTVGHSPGHQSLLVRGTPDGTVLLAGQAFDSASEFASAALARQLGAELPDLSAPSWVDDLLASGIDVAMFAHDLAQWRPAPAFSGTRRRPPWDQP